MKKVYKLLILEDDPNSVLLVEKALGRYNFQIDVAQNGIEGLIKVKKKKYDLIISDIMMPGMDGLEFIERSENFTTGIPIIMLTAAGDKDRVLRAAQNNVAQYLLKPIRPRILLEKVLETLKLDLDNLVDIKLLPFRLLVKVEVDNVLNFQWVGCPEKSNQENIINDISRSVLNYPKINTYLFELGASLIYFNESLQLIEDAITTILMRNPNCSPNDITLRGEFLKDVSVNELHSLKYLSKCNISR
ncbi:MAG: response regulator [Leptospiraceae bacterium]|nr:response regulator [Leptospiraceae bacterium]MCK6382559.1 response regulator [Leptospiraceae bacterium]